MSDVMNAMGNLNILIVRNTDMDWSALNNGSQVNSAVVVKIGSNRLFALGFRSYAGVSDVQSRMFFATFDGSNALGWFELAKADASTTSALNAKAEEINED